MSTQRISVIPTARAAFIAALAAPDNGFEDAFTALQVIQEMSNIKKVHSRRILIGGKGTPEVVGSKIVGWEVDLIIQCLSDFNEHSETEHDEMCAPIEDFCLVEDLAARMTTAAFKVQVATPGPVQNDFQDGERITEIHVILDCHLTGV